MPKILPIDICNSIISLVTHFQSYIKHTKYLLTCRHFWHIRTRLIIVFLSWNCQKHGWIHIMFQAMALLAMFMYFEPEYASKIAMSIFDILSFDRRSSWWRYSNFKIWRTLWPGDVINDVMNTPQHVKLIHRRSSKRFLPLPRCRVSLMLVETTHPWWTLNLFQKARLLTTGAKNLLTTDRQSTVCKAAIEPDQITLCWRSDATRKRFVCAPMAMLEIYGVQFPVWLRCRRPLLIPLRCTWSDYDQIATYWLQSWNEGGVRMRSRIYNDRRTA